MIVSCLCPTYNRPPHFLHLLEEAVESFLRQQQYMPAGVEAELVVLNDCPQQKLVFDDAWLCDVANLKPERVRERVRLVNLPGRVPSLGEKRNLLVELARGDVLLPWDDDDISLPGRIGQAVKELDIPFAGAAKYWKPPQVFFLDGNGLHHRHAVGVRHHASAYTREAWRLAGGYPHTSGNEDMRMDERLMPFGHNIVDYPSGMGPADWFYIYRWSVAPHHISGVAGGPPEDPHAPHYAAIGEKPILTGEFVVRPRWRQDYEKLVAAAIA